jgi:hypothetical protein
LYHIPATGSTKATVLENSIAPVVDPAGGGAPELTPSLLPYHYWYPYYYCFKGHEDILLSYNAQVNNITLLGWSQFNGRGIPYDCGTRIFFPSSFLFSSVYFISSRHTSVSFSSLHYLGSFFFFSTTLQGQLDSNLSV